MFYFGRFSWPRGQSRWSAAVRLLILQVRIPPWAWMSVSCECSVLSGRGLCVGLITRSEESYIMWCLSKCDREASVMRRPWPTVGCCGMGRSRRRKRRFIWGFKCSVIQCCVAGRVVPHSCDHLRCYAASSHSVLKIFRDNISVPS